MSSYLMLFRNASKPDGYLTTPEDMMEDMPKWQSWIGQIAMQGKLIHTAPIEFDGLQVDASKSAPGPHKEAQEVLVVGYIICKADSLDEAQAWASTCPILRYPHSSVEIRPILPFAIS